MSTSVRIYDSVCRVLELGKLSLLIRWVTLSSELIRLTIRSTSASFVCLPGSNLLAPGHGRQYGQNTLVNYRAVLSNQFLECVRRARLLAKDSRNQYTADEPSEMTSHLLKYGCILGPTKLKPYIQGANV